MSSTVGSQLLLQATVRQSEALIDEDLRTALGIPQSTAVEWMSPIEADDNREYRDQEALTRVGVTLTKLPLAEFWPARGPVWDGLARTDVGQVILVEAKAHIAELASPGTRAGEASLVKIEQAFQQVRQVIAPRSSASWTSTFYQYANRLAFLYLLLHNGVDAHLVHVLYTNAQILGSPASAEEWRGALALLRAALGLSDHRLKPYVHELVIDANRVAVPVARRELEA